MSYKDFTAMPVWQHALEMLIHLYDITKKFPKEEIYGMTADMRRSGNSVTHNLAEGFGRYENKDKSRFYKISRGSAYEIISQTLTSHALHFLSMEEKDELFHGYKEIINEEDRLIKSVEHLKKPT